MIKRYFLFIFFSLIAADSQSQPTGPHSGSESPKTRKTEKRPNRLNAIPPDSLLIRAESLLKEGKDHQSLLLFRNLHQEYKTLSDHKGMAIVLRDIGIIHFRADRYKEALEAFKNSLELDRKLPAMRLMRDTYLRLFAESRLNKDSSLSNSYSRSYKVYRDSVEWMINSRALSPDSLASESTERSFVNLLTSKSRQDFMDQESVRSLEFSQKLTEAELERLKAEEAIAKLNKEREEDEAANKERSDRIDQLEKLKAIQDLALSEKELKAAKQQQFIQWLAAGTILVIGGFGFTWNRYRIKKKSHLALDKAYSELSGAHRKLKAMQEQLVHSEKMASLGQMTSGIAHEIQNPLNFVNNFAHVSKDLLEELRNCTDHSERNELVKELSENLERIENHGKRAESIVKNMLLHSRSSKSEKELFDIHKLIHESVVLAKEEFKISHPDFNVNTEIKPDEHLTEFWMVKQDTGRVLLNIFKNALYAMHKNQMINPSSEPKLEISTLKLSKLATIRIRDNGPGMSNEVKQKIFQPFFTTKPPGEGTGLGLSLSFDLIKSQGGEIKVDCPEEGGCIFTVILPLS